MSVNPFKPAWWLLNSHLQTIWPAICRRSINIPLRRERIEMPDGDFIDLDWLVTSQKTGPLILILHGLEGSIESHYAKGMLAKIGEKGWRGVFMHFRGCSGEPNRLSRDYHAGEIKDIDYIVRLLMQREPHLNLGLIGFSLGGNVLLKWLGLTGRKNQTKAAIAISVPFELQKAANRVQKGFSKFYQWYFIKCLRSRLSQKFKRVLPPMEPNGIYEAKTMVDFDDKVVAPINGFFNVDEYYISASSRQYLRMIEVPTLIVHAKDDPFMSEDVIPTSDEISPHVQLEITETGGHVGFIAGKYPWRPEYWLEQRVPDFLVKHLK